MLTVLLSSPRVAPGLLSWQAWSALREAALVLSGPGGHPLNAPLAAADVVTSAVDGDAVADGASLAAFLSGAAAGAGGPVVWLAPPGERSEERRVGKECLE